MNWPVFFGFASIIIAILGAGWRIANLLGRIETQLASVVKGQEVQNVELARMEGNVNAIAINAATITERVVRHDEDIRTIKNDIGILKQGFVEVKTELKNVCDQIRTQKPA